MHRFEREREKNQKRERETGFDLGLLQVLGTGLRSPTF